MIAAVSTIRNEADIISLSLRHLFAEGIDLVLIADASSDGTRQILDQIAEETGKVDWRVDGEPFHRQTYWIDRLAAEAYARGAEWIIPWDADEFWYVDGRPIAEALNALGPDVRRVDATLWNHVTPERRLAEPVHLPKVAYRWEPDAHIAPGSHGVSVGGATAHGFLNVRHWPWRTFGQFCRKVEERNQTLEPEGWVRGDGVQHTRLQGASHEQLRAAWEEWQASPTVDDPIPVRQFA